MVMIVITHMKVNPIHGYDSHYPLEGEPNLGNDYHNHRLDWVRLPVCNYYRNHVLGSPSCG
jgi:hypothetical protein